MDPSQPPSHGRVELHKKHVLDVPAAGEHVKDSLTVLDLYGDVVSDCPSIKPYFEAPAIAPPEDHPALGDAAKWWEDKKSCLINTVAACGESIGVPITFGDTPLDAISYLAEEWEHYPPGTPIVVAKHGSTGGSLYILVNNLRVALKASGVPALVPYKPAPPRHSFFVDPISFSLIMGCIAQGAASQLGSQLFTSMSKAIPIFASSGPPSLKDIADAVRGVVRGELGAEALKEAETKTKAVYAYMANEYPHLGQDTDEKKKTRDLELAMYNQDMYFVVSTLSRDDIRKPGFCAFMLAAAEHLAILKERANLMPAETSRADTVKQTAHQYAESASKTLNELYNERMTAITDPSHTVSYTSAGAYGAARNDYWGFEDSFPAKRYWSYNVLKNYDAESDCRNNHKSYKDGVEKEFKGKVLYDKQVEVINAWRGW